MKCPLAVAESKDPIRLLLIDLPRFAGLTSKCNRHAAFAVWERKHVLHQPSFAAGLLCIAYAVAALRVGFWLLVETEVCAVTKVDTSLQIRGYTTAAAAAAVTVMMLVWPLVDIEVCAVTEVNASLQNENIYSSSRSGRRGRSVGLAAG
jgi:hypothetical protein